MQKRALQGFTLIEVLLVIAILAILAAVVIIAVNPAKQLATARDAQRTSDVFTILNALHQYAIDHEGAFPDSVTTNEGEVCRTTSVTCLGVYDLSALTTGQLYLTSIPLDPLCGLDSPYCSDEGTGYFIQETENGRMTVWAPNTETKNEISVTR